MMPAVKPATDNCAAPCASQLVNKTEKFGRAPVRLSNIVV